MDNSVSADSLGKVIDEVACIFDADGKAEQAFCDAAGLSFFFGEVAVRLGSRIGNEAFHAAKAFSKADELDVLEDLQRCLMGVGVEGKHSAGASGLLVMDILVFETGKSRVQMMAFWAASLLMVANVVWVNPG